MTTSWFKKTRAQDGRRTDTDEDRRKTIEGYCEDTRGILPKKSWPETIIIATPPWWFELVAVPKS